MTKRQANKYRMFKKLQKFNHNYAQLLSTVPGYAAEAAQLDIELLNLDNCIVIQIKDLTGITTDVKMLKKSMAQYVYQIAVKALPKARKINNKDLMGILNISESFIYKATMSDALVRAFFIRDTLEGNPAIFTNITTQNIADMTALINNYNVMMCRPKAEQAHRKAYGTETLPVIYKRLAVLKENMHDFLFGEFAQSNKEIVGEFKLVTRNPKYGIRHTNALFNTWTKGMPKNIIEGAEGYIVELNLKSKSNIYGLLSFCKIKNGTYHFIFKKKGFKDVEKIIEVKRGKTMTMDIEMEKIV